MTWTTPRTWTTGETVTATMMNTYVSNDLLHLYNRHQVTRSTADTAAATTGTYVAPTGFTALTVNSGLTYQFSVIGVYSASVTSLGLQVRLAYPSLTAGVVYPITSTGSTAFSNGGTQALPASPVTITAANAGTTSGLGFQINGMFTASASGTFALTFTPSSAGTLTLRNNTYMSLIEVG